MNTVPFNYYYPGFCLTFVELTFVFVWIQLCLWCCQLQSFFSSTIESENFKKITFSEWEKHFIVQQLCFIEENIYFLILNRVGKIWMFQLTIHVSVSTHGSRFSLFDSKCHRNSYKKFTNKYCPNSLVWINRILRQSNGIYEYNVYFIYCSRANNRE